MKPVAQFDQIVDLYDKTRGRSGEAKRDEFILGLYKVYNEEDEFDLEDSKHVYTVKYLAKFGA